MKPLSAFCGAGAPGPDEPERVVCLGDAGVRTRAHLERDVRALSAELARRGGGRWLVCTESAYACAVALLALWRAGAVAVLPPNLEPGSVRELAAAQPRAQGVLADSALAADGLAAVPILAADGGGTRDAIDGPGPGAVVLELCTSGSTGARKVVPKTLAQLDAEIAALEQVAEERILDTGAARGQARAPRGPLAVHGTVSFQHIYGLLFRVLWPLAAGRAFADAAVADPALIARAFEQGRGWLVSSPAHLKRLPELLDLARLRGTCAQVFSSGGALDPETASRFERELGHAPLEVLGSTETGGIAWRRQGAVAAGSGSAAGAPWRPLPGVRVEARDGLLAVRSAPAGGREAVVTGDAIELLGDGTFALLGRADRIVKLFDERVSLVELEARLAAHPAVASAAAVVLARRGTPRIAAAVVLAPSGAEALRAHGKQPLAASLRAHLAGFFRDTALPRAWRFVARLPEDAQGKTSVAALEALFAAPEEADSNGAADATGAAGAHGAASGSGAPPGVDGPLAPRALSAAQRSEGAYEVELEVPAELWCLRGHFDGFPVVPGVVQLQWALDCAADWLGATPAVRGVEALKYKQILAAGTRFRLRLERAGDGAKLRFRLWNDQGEFSSGRVLVGAEG